MKYKPKSLSWKLVLCLLALCQFSLSAGELKTKATLVSEQETIAPGQTFTVALKFEIADHWHTYWRNAGDAGLATSITWELPEGFSAGEIQWPYPKRLPVPGGILNFGYEGEVWHLVDIKAPENLKPGTQVVLKARVDWLECEEICVPGRADLQLKLKAEVEAKRNETLLADFSKAREKLAVVDKNPAFRAEQRGSELYLIWNKPSLQKELLFFPDQEGLIVNSSDQTLVSETDSQQLVIRLEENIEPLKKISGVLVGNPGWGDSPRKSLEFELEVRQGVVGFPVAESKKAGFWGSILLGFIGGLILNLMPCVFPVLGLKIMGFAKQAGQDRKSVARHGWVFSAGVLISFWILAGVLLVLRAGGQELGWGFQLQSAPFVYVLLLLLLAFGLNMSGVFEVGASLVGVGSNLQSGSSYSGSFFSGVLATVVATPCAAPFLAPALGAALALPVLPSLALFTAIAAGLAAPYLLLSLRPELVKALPRPGAWMESFKQFLAFLLYGAAAYLLWVLDGQVGEYELLNILFSLVLVALGCWIYGRFTGFDRDTRGRNLGRLGAAVFVGLGLYLGFPSSNQGKTTEAQGIVWEAWSPELVEKYQSENRIIYVDFTARWCATCQTNKKAVFSSQKVLDEFKRLQIVTLKADWTNQDPRITKALSAFGKSAVPFNLIYAPGMDQPRQLPELLTPGIILEELGRLHK